MISKDQKSNIICTIDDCGEAFYGHHTAKHPAAVTTNNNEKFRSFKSKENVHKKEVGPYQHIDLMYLSRTWHTYLFFKINYVSA